MTITTQTKGVARRALAASAAVAGIGSAMVTLPADPASAHEITITRGDSNATVGAAHAGIRVCRWNESWPVSRVEWRNPGDGTIRGIATVGNPADCASHVDDRPIAVFRLCLMQFNGRFDLPHTCTGWKRVT
jgi:hypothetical protein